MGSQQGARPTYNPPPPSRPLRSCSSPPIALFHPRLIWQWKAKESGERESPRDTAHLQTSHSCLSFPRLVTLSLYFALTSLSSPARPIFSSPQFCLRFNFSRLPSSYSRRETGSVQPGWCKTLCHFCFVLPTFFFLFCLNWSSSTFSVFFFCFWTYLKSKILLGMSPSQCQPHIRVSVWHTYEFFSSVWVSALMSETLQPLLHPYSHFYCFKSSFTWTFYSLEEEITQNM